MFFVYILESLKSGRFYIGSTEDVVKRLEKHNSGLVNATSKFRPFKLVFKQSFSNLATARSVEARLKKFKRKDFLVKIIADGEIKFLGH